MVVPRAGRAGPKPRAPRFFRHNKQSHVDGRKINMYKLIKLIRILEIIKAPPPITCIEFRERQTSWTLPCNHRPSESSGLLRLPLYYRKMFYLLMDLIIGNNVLVAAGMGYPGQLFYPSEVELICIRAGKKKEPHGGARNKWTTFIILVLEWKN